MNRPYPLLVTRWLCAITLIFVTTISAAAKSAALTITLVTPTAFYNNVTTQLTIEGSGLTGLSRLYLGEFALEHLDIIDDAHATADVPWGKAPGVYSLTAVDQDGQRVEYAQPLTVQQGLYQWSTGGPYGGWMSQLFPAGSDQFWAVMEESGLYHGIATKDGVAWDLRLLGSMLTRPGILPANPQVIIAGGQCSTDGGLSWVNCIPAGIRTDKVPFEFFATAAPDASGRIFMSAAFSRFAGVTGSGYGEGLYVTTDNGQNWQKVTIGSAGSPQPNLTALTFNPLNPQQALAGSEIGEVYYSADSGATWTQVGTLPANESGSFPPILQNFTFDPHSSTVWATALTGNYGRTGLFRAEISPDAPWTWTELWIPGTGGPNDIAHNLVYHPAIAGTAYLAAGGGYTTTDNGVTWTPFTNPLPEMYDLIVRAGLTPDDASGTVLLAATRRGLYVSKDNGQSWTVQNQGLTGIVPDSIAALPANPDIAYAADPSLGLARTTDGGRSWNVIRPDLSGALALNPFAADEVYLGVMSPEYRPAMLVSTDQGQNFTQADLPTPAGIVNKPGAAGVVAFNPRVPRAALAGATYFLENVHGNFITGGGLYYLENGAWNLASQPEGMRGVNAIAFDPSNPDVAYAGTDAYGLLKTSDGGKTWSVLNPLPMRILSIAVDPANPRVLYVAMQGILTGPDPASPYQNGVYRSDDGGLTWNLVGEFLPSALAFTPTAPYRLFAAAGGEGLQVSADQGQTWQRAAGLPGAANISVLSIAQKDGRLVIYVSMTGGFTEQGARLLASPGLLDPGVYRLTEVIRQVYLPAVQK